ncbi:MAG: putative DNA binding domain-containing protein [Kiritimatiellae bacterium]|nr:putative DNA binding domain-containing protein [Kiritimatiellia bacterium]
MSSTDLLARVARGEDSATQFKADVRNGDSLASELAAFANCEGGVLFIGVADNGTTPGLSREDVSRVNQLIGNAASQLVRSPLAVQTQNIQLQNGRIVILLTVPKGIDKPYFDKNGVIWLKCGADKRRINSKEELRRFFQFADQFHADELPTKAGLDKLDRERFGLFLRTVFKQEYPKSEADRLQLLQNMNLATDLGVLNLAGVLLFAKDPERIKPSFVVKAIAFPGTTVAASVYDDSEDFSGSLPVLFQDAMAFIKRNLRKVQAGRGVNAPGTPEIPLPVFEELLVNALIHRDYLIEAPIRLFVFSDRIEIISPGHLPNHLTVEKIRAGNSNIRNPILASFVAKGLLPYHGIGSGIKRALADWPDIAFADDRDGCLFTAIVRRKAVRSPAASSPKTPLKTSVETSVETSVKTPARILNILASHPEMTLAQVSAEIGKSQRAIEMACAKLIQAKRLKHKGPNKGGHWEVLK